MTKYCFVVVSNPVTGREAEYNTWYNTQHLQDVLKIPGFVAVQRFKVTHDSALPGQYIALYEMETDNPQAVLDNLHSRAGTPAMQVSDALDASTVSTTLCVAVSERVIAK
jgi:hypothetical protein